MLIDDYLPRFDFVERHRIRIGAPIDRVYKETRNLDLSDSLIVRALFGVRGITQMISSRRKTVRPAINMQTILDNGFILLGENHPEEMLIGIVGRFWTPSGGVQKLDADGFRQFDKPSYAKAVWNFSLSSEGDNSTLLATETRILCLDAKSRKRFRIYWFGVRPFSGLIRRIALRVVRKRAEEATG